MIFRLFWQQSYCWWLSSSLQFFYMHTKRNKMLKMLFFITKKMKSSRQLVVTWVHTVPEAVILMLILVEENLYMLSYDTDTLVVHTIIIPVNKFHAYSALEVFHLDKDKRVEALELKWVWKCVKSVRKKSDKRTLFMRYLTPSSTKSIQNVISILKWWLGHSTWKLDILIPKIWHNPSNIIKNRINWGENSNEKYLMQYL